MTDSPVVTIIDTGIANTASVVAAMARCGARAVITHDAAAVERADRLVLPGVGAFGAGMDRLGACGLIEPLRDRIGAGRPTLAICLGFQLLFDESEESAGVAGLGVAPGLIERYPESVRVPQFGWNRVASAPGSAMVRTGYAYFANSYRAGAPVPGWACAMADHGGPFVAAMERGAVLACQFHPELSGRWGLDLLDRWIACARQEVASC
jgi:imidazole glycerol phosphate synthase glutamine amidotransferase subunit